MNHMQPVHPNEPQPAVDFATGSNEPLDVRGQCGSGRPDTSSGNAAASLNTAVTEASTEGTSTLSANDGDPSNPTVPGYEILSVLGRGGMGVVYKARQNSLKRTVALKMMLAGQHSGAHERVRFRIEAEAVARLQHPNIVQIHEVGESDGCPYCALEFVEGGSLASKICGNPLAAMEAARLVETLARAMQLAHSRNVVHRDLKPGNILLAADGTPKISDFGLARRLDTESSETQVGAIVGTPSYMAPEQASGFANEAGPAADVYALGAILYDCLIGQPPFRGKTVSETIDQVRTQEPAPPSSRSRNVPIDLERICLKCLRKEPEKRYASAGELADDLGRLLRGEPVLARPVGHGQRLWRWCRRNPAVAASLALLGSILPIAFLIVSRSYWKAEEARKDAVKERDTAQWREYCATMQAVSSAFNLNSVAEARRLLEASNPDYCGWEWQHFVSRLDGAKAVLKHNASASHAESERLGELPIVAFSADGTRVATSSSDGWCRVWDAATGKMLIQKPGLAKEVFLVAFLPNGRLISVTREGTARIWKPDTPDAPPDAEVPVGDAVFATLSPDGSYLAWDTGNPSEVWGWDWQKNASPQLLVKGVEGRFVFSKDSRLLAVPITHGEIAIWDVAKHAVVKQFPAHFSKTNRLAFGPGGDRLVSGSLYPESEVRLWTTDGKNVHRQNVHRNSIFDLAYSPDGSRIASASLDQTIGLWHGATLQPVALLRGHTGRVLFVKFTPDSQRLLSMSDDQSIRLWDAARGDPVAVLHGHTGRVNFFTLSPDGNTLASTSADGTVRLWDLKKTEARGGLRGHTSYVYDASFSPDGKQIASAAWDGTVRIWDTAALREVAVLKQETKGDPIVRCIAWSRDGRLLAAIAEPDFVHIWDTKQHKKLRTLHVHNGHWKADIRAAFNHDGTVLATGSNNGNVFLWNPETGDKLVEWNGHNRHRNADTLASDVAFSPDGRTLATVGGDGVLNLWRVSDLLAGNTAEPLASLSGHTDIINRVVWSKDGELLATASNDRSVKLWSAKTLQEIATLPHGSIVYGVTLSPDGRRLASGCADNTIRIWDMTRHDQVTELRGHNGFVKSVAFSPDGKRMVSASGDYTLRVWDTLSAQEQD